MFEQEFEGTPGPELLGELASMEVPALHPLQRSWALTAVARMESWLAAQRCRLLLELGADFEQRLGGGNAADEVMAAQRVSAYAAERVVRLARSARRAPALLKGLESGKLGVPHAHRLSQLLEDLDTPDAAVVAERVCSDKRLPHWSVGDVGRATARIAAELDPQAVAARRRRQERQADVSMEPAADGMAWMTAYGPAEDVAAAMSAVNEHALAARRAEDAARAERTPIGVLRFQAFVRLLLGRANDAPEAPSSVVTQVTVPFTTLAGVDDAPGELSGYGPIPGPVARDLAARSPVWWRLLTDPVTGALCPVSSSAYRIPEAVRRFVMARDRVCSHPGCDRPAPWCDLDHAEAYPSGPTCPCNLTPRCRRHHNAKTHHGWQVRARLDGQHLTVSPTGRVYATAVHPPPGPMTERPPPDGVPLRDLDDLDDVDHLDDGWEIDDEDAREQHVLAGRGDFGSFDDLANYLFNPGTGRNNPVVAYLLAAS